MLAAARQDPDCNRREKFRPLLRSMEDHRRRPFLTFPPAPAFHESRFAVVAADVSLVLLNHFRSSRLSSQHPCHIQFDQLVAVIRFSAWGFPAEKISAPRGRARFPRPGSIVMLRVRGREWALVERGLPRANPFPATDRRSFAGVAQAQSDRAVVAKSTTAISGRPSV